MTATEQAWAEGFMQKCADAGVDPVELCKQAGLEQSIIKLLTRLGPRALNFGRGAKHLGLRLPGMAKRFGQGVWRGYDDMFTSFVNSVGRPLGVLDLPIRGLGDLADSRAARIGSLVTPAAIAGGSISSAINTVNRARHKK